MKMYKRFGSNAMMVIFAMLFGFAVMVIGTETAHAMEGNGTKENPYKISTYAELKEFAKIVNGTHSEIAQNASACAKLTADFECTDKEWEPIGTQANPYAGTFDGSGKIIEKLSNKDREEDVRQGLFGTASSGAIIQDVGLKDVYIKGKGLSGGIVGENKGAIQNCYVTGAVSRSKLYYNEGQIGGVAGRNYGTIKNCYNTGDVSGTGDHSYSVGGVAGRNEGTIENCYNTGDVSGTGDTGNAVGGVTGSNKGTIKNCYSTGDVSGTGGAYYIGGVAGSNIEGTITNCYNAGSVSGSGNNVGGVAGRNSGTITNCYNTGDVSGTGDTSNDVGGVAGLIDGKIENCYNIGSVSGNENVGGVAGYNDWGGTIKNCYNTGDVSGSGDDVGGVAGFNHPYGTVTNCFSTGDVKGNGHVGGVAGWNNDGTVTNCYYDAELCKDKKAIGTADDTDNVKGLTTDQMTGKGTLNNMPFVYGTGETPPWMEKANDKNARYYPHLKGFNFDDDGKQMDAKDISADNWPPKTDALVVETPTFSPAARDFGPQQSITISCATDGAAIYYTTDGSDPTTSSSKYTKPITISDTTTIKAFAVKEGAVDSEVATATYTHVHKYGAWTKLNATQHQRVCEHDATHVEKENHTWNTEWSADGENHWHECSICGAHKDEAAHSGGTATCKEKAKCETCNEEYGNLGQHKYGAWTKFNATQHQKVCEHDASHVEKENHSWDAGKVTKKATEKATGIKTYTCTVCKATKTETIPKLKPSIPKVSGTPLAKATVKKKSMTIGWNKIQGAEGYDVFFALCNHNKKEIKCKKVRTIKGNKTFKWTKSGLKNGTAYKFYVRAYVTKNGKKTYVSKTPMFHAYTGNGTKNYTNAKSVSVNKTKVTLKKGKIFKIKAKVNKVNKKKKLMPKSHATTLRYMTSNKKVATVNSSGKITAKGKGTCYIYVYAHNGVSKQIKVTAK